MFGVTKGRIGDSMGNAVGSYTLYCTYTIHLQFVDDKTFRTNTEFDVTDLVFELNTEKFRS